MDKYIICESAFWRQELDKNGNYRLVDRTNPEMHIREDDEELGIVKVTHCGLRVTADCPYLPISAWGEEDVTEKDVGEFNEPEKPREWCQQCGLAAKRHLNVSSISTVEDDVDEFKEELKGFISEIKNIVHGPFTDEERYGD